MDKKHAKIAAIVEKELSGSAHTLDHVVRVYNMCLELAKTEKNIDLDVLKTAALLHDIARLKEDNDKSGKTNHAILGAAIASKILNCIGYPKQIIHRVKHCILCHRSRDNTEPKTKEAEILSDADKLDILGAIGIARMFSYVGEYGQRIFSDVPVRKYMKRNFIGCNIRGRVKDASKHAPNLEYETKVKSIPKRLYTKHARKIAKERMKYMDKYFSRMKKELSGKL
ncbi:MAG: HD domain-containing protein [Candidatus Woesearchaeota archaeon]